MAPTKRMYEQLVGAGEERDDHVDCPDRDGDHPCANCLDAISSLYGD